MSWLCVQLTRGRSKSGVVYRLSLSSTVESGQVLFRLLVQGENVQGWGLAGGALQMCRDTDTDPVIIVNISDIGLLAVFM